MRSAILESTYRRLPGLCQSAAVSGMGYLNRLRRHGRLFRDELNLLEQSDKFSASELEALQNERLRVLINTAYAHVPYYRELFARLKLTPNDLRNAHDLRRLPVLEKSGVQEAGLRLVSEALPRRARIAGSTSGSTGTPLALVHDHLGLAAEFATVWRLRRRFGCDLDQWHATFAGRLVVPIGQSHPPFHRINHAQRQVLFSLYHLKPTHVAAYAEALAAYRYSFYSGYPSALTALVQLASETGTTLPAPERALFTSSESLLAWQKRGLEEAFGVPAYDRYGCAEFCVSFTVCPEGRYHLDSEFAIVEVEPQVETDTAITGPLLCTGLMNRAMPFIRYRVGDVVTMAKTPCPCGRASLSAFNIDGRQEDQVLTRDGVRLGRLDHLFKNLRSIRESQIIQQRAGEMTIRLVRGPEFGLADARKLLQECRSRMGDKMDVELEYAEQIPRNAAGKFRAVISKTEEVHGDAS